MKKKILSYVDMGGFFMRIKSILQSLLFAYAMTGGFLFLFAFLVYKMELGELHVAAGILTIYFLASFAGGRMAGRQRRKEKVMMGGLTGLGYFLLLIFVSVFVRGELQMTPSYIVTALSMCLGGGVLGGILS